MTGDNKMNPINKATLLKKVRQSGSWEGYICPNKANPYFQGGSLFSIKIELAGMHDRPSKFVVTTNGQRADLDRYLNEFRYYNCNAELGYTVKFWEIVK